ncbi:hypothetical protein GTCCBUS3UF5_16980 [Geobacillus thermoleovorans CCB_US3_UF5]|uniref:Uncharacterized protein n=1 Tax=Geobacillus thermoleovorans CCB_US3_UF5 TaxID=1111068 RepID=A0ABM5MHG4_GEOTH|nr:hypothetical protein GTCCBUS3UF5_16980 [Geobacillus thermoleovorans CCB_US3_UF5]
MEGEMDFHAWVGSKIYSWMFYDILMIFSFFIDNDYRCYL